jgi:hypothetical protein
VPSAPEPTSEHHERLWGLVGVLVVVVVLAVLMTAGVTSGRGSSTGAGAGAWVARERPAGPVLTVDGWTDAVADGDRLRVVAVPESELSTVAAAVDVGSIVAPSDSPVVAVLARDAEWTVTYRDDGATVLVRDGALPVPGAT